jgi:hypothetical protein
MSVSQAAVLDLPVPPAHRLADVVRGLPELPGKQVNSFVVLYLFFILSRIINLELAEYGGELQVCVCWYFLNIRFASFL